MIVDCLYTVSHQVMSMFGGRRCVFAVPFDKALTVQIMSDSGRYIYLPESSSSLLIDKVPLVGIYTYQGQSLSENDRANTV
jgi:hypothetical protein